MHETLDTDTYYDFDDLSMFIQFGTLGEDALQLRFKTCVNNLWTARYLFSELNDPDKEFDDAKVTEPYEQISSFFIKGN